MTMQVVWSKHDWVHWRATVENPDLPGERYSTLFPMNMFDVDHDVPRDNRVVWERNTLMWAKDYFDHMKTRREYEALPDWLKATSMDHCCNYPNYMIQAALSVCSRTPRPRSGTSKIRDDYRLISPVKGKP